MPENLGVEPPIYIESFQQHRDHLYAATNGDAAHRHPVRLEEIWDDYATIPDVPDPTLLLDGDTAGYVVLRKGRALVPVAGTTLKFELGVAPAALTRVITATHGQAAPVGGGSVAPTLRMPPAPATGYAPVIRDGAGAVHPMKASEWVVDGLNHYVEFPYGVPEGMGPPFTLTNFEYTGTVGGTGPIHHPWERVPDVTGMSVRLALTFPTAVTDNVVFPARSTEGASSRFMFLAAQSAVRGGEVTGTQWDVGNRGRYSTAFGLNTTASGYASYAAGEETTASGEWSCVAGGQHNTASGTHAFVAGGQDNMASGDHSVVAGGQNNRASGPHSMVGGGQNNFASAAFSSVGGGDNNQALALGAVVGGGHGNQVLASGDYGAIGGGLNNTVEGVKAFVGGGSGNKAAGIAAVVVGGENNSASGQESFVGGGRSNTTLAAGLGAVVGGGQGNEAWNEYSVVAGGGTNRVTGHHATVVGGQGNEAEGNHAAVPGGQNNSAKGANSWAFGLNCTASGANSLAGGNEATANGKTSLAFGTKASSGGHANTVTLCDDSPLTAAAPNGYYAGFAGGHTLYTNAARTLGARLGPGLSAWAAVSDRAAKENFRPLEGVLERLERVPVYEYNYKGTAPDLVCRGPVAQDWHAAFPSAKDPLRIDTMDLDGVALAAIKELAAAARTHQAEAEDLRGMLRRCRAALQLAGAAGRPLCGGVM